MTNQREYEPTDRCYACGDDASETVRIKGAEYPRCTGCAADADHIHNGTSSFGDHSRMLTKLAAGSRLGNPVTATYLTRRVIEHLLTISDEDLKAVVTRCANEKATS